MKDVKDTVPIGPHHDLARTPLPFDVGQYGNLRRVVVELIVRRKLVVPFELAGIGVECHDRARIEVVPWTWISIPVGAGVSRTPISQVEFRIVAAGGPNGTAAMSPGVSAPGLVAGLAGFGNHVEAPLFVAGFGIERRDVAANAIFTACGTKNDLIFRDERHQGE